MMKRLIAVAAVLALSLAGAVVAHADERDDLRGQISENEEELERLASELEGVDTNLQETYLALEASKQRLVLAREELRLAEEALEEAVRVQEQVAARLAYAENQLETLDEEISETKLKIEDTESSLGELARTTYQNGIAPSPAVLLLSSASSSDFVAQYSAMESAVRSQTASLTEHNDLGSVLRNAEARQEAVTESIEELKIEADEAVVAADTARAIADDRKRELDDLVAEQSRYASQLERRADEIANIQSTIESDNQSMLDDIKRIDDEEAKKQREAEEAARKKAEEDAKKNAASGNSGGSSGGSGGGSGGGSSSGGTSSSSAFAPPIPGSLYVTSPFGWRHHPIGSFSHLHTGVDLRSACGNAQYATASGTVSSVRGALGNKSHGNQVFINHGTVDGDRYQSVHNHLSRFGVSEGQWVNQGDVIGYTGATGNVTGCHVHFELWKNGTAIDPMTLPGFR